MSRTFIHRFIHRWKIFGVPLSSSELLLLFYNGLSTGKSSLSISAKPGGVGAASLLWIAKGEQSGLRTRSVLTESGSLCVRTKSSTRFGTGLRFALAAIGIDNPARFFQTRRRLTSLNSGGGLTSPLGSSPVPDPHRRNQCSGGERKESQ